MQLGPSSSWFIPRASFVVSNVLHAAAPAEKQLRGAPARLDIWVRCVPESVSS